MTFTLTVLGTLVLAAAPPDEQPKSPYAAWTRGPSADPGYFPIAVWLQDPKNAARYKAAGINLYVALWRGPTDEQLAQLKEAGVQVICSPGRNGQTHRDDPTIVGWMHGDEPDNAQPVTDPKTGKRGYGPPVPPPKIVADYEKYRAMDPTRPILLNLGQGVANDRWVGRGPEGKKEDYLTYVKGGDIISYDVYPVAGVAKKGEEPEITLVAKGLDRLTQWSEGKRILWNCIECTHIDDADMKATPVQVKAEVWLSLVHGSNGLIYFVHQFKPKFNEHALLDDPEMLAMLTASNKQIKELAPVLNSPALRDGVKVESSSPIDAVAKRHAGSTYVFAVNGHDKATEAKFTVQGLSGEAKVEVIGENRSLSAKGGQVADKFGAYEVHLYRVSVR